MRRFFILTISINLLLFSCEEKAPEKIGTDYHLHIRSPRMSEAMSSLCGTMINDCPEKGLPSSGANQIMTSFDSTIFNRGVILSMGYMASMNELNLDYETHKELTRYENTYTRDEAAKNDKLYAFISVNPLTDYSLDEAKYWMTQDGIHGLKLHLANSDLDLLNEEHVAKLKAIIDVVDQPGMTVLAHVRNRNPEYGNSDMEVYLNEIIAKTEHAQFIIAHAAGWGFYDDATDAALNTVIDAINTKKVDPERTFIGTGAVLFNSQNRADNNIPDDYYAEKVKQFKEKFRSVSINNWVFGSDWSADGDRFEPYACYEEMLAVGFTQEEVDAVVGNALNFLK